MPSHPKGACHRRRSRGSVGLVLGVGALLAMVGAPAEAPVVGPAYAVAQAVSVPQAADVPRVGGVLPVGHDLPPPSTAAVPANAWAAGLLAALLTAPVADGAAASASLDPADLAAIDPRVDVSGIPARVLEAYRAAAARLAAEQPRCGVPWELIAAIGRVESGHGSFGGAAVRADGRIVPEIIGLRLDGAGPVSEIRDTDGGLLDRDTEYDRAVGPMQFIPGTWAGSGADGDGDGRTDPHDIDDAALGTGRYLCASGSVGTMAGKVRAAYRYNHSYDYVRLVLTIAAGYAGTTPEAFGATLLPAASPATPLPASALPVAAPAPADPPAPAPVPVAPSPVPTVPPATPQPTTTPPPTTPPPTTPPPTAPQPTTPIATPGPSPTADPVEPEPEPAGDQAAASPPPGDTVGSQGPG
jgi:hypothetical protein